mgnify:CR=1 FL=1
MRGLAPQLIYPLILPPQESRTLDDGDKTPTRRFADLTCESIPFSGMLLLYEHCVSGFAKEKNLYNSFFKIGFFEFFCQIKRGGGFPRPLSNSR